MDTKEKIEVMQAYLYGKTIEVKFKTDNDWKDKKFVTDPIWDWYRCDYRIKEEKRRLCSIGDLPLGEKIVTLVFPTGLKSIVYAWDVNKLYYFHSILWYATIEQLYKDGVKWSVDGGKTTFDF